MIRVLCILQLIVELLIVKVYVSYAWKVLNVFRFINAKFVAHNAELLELHNVLCEGASFIAENVVDHTQLFI